MVAASSFCVAEIAPASSVSCSRRPRSAASSAIRPPWPWCVTIICRNITSSALRFASPLPSTAAPSAAAAAAADVADRAIASGAAASPPQPATGVASAAAAISAVILRITGSAGATAPA